MPIFTLTLQPTYCKMGFFNVTVDFDRYVRKSEGPVELRLGGDSGQVIVGRIDRHANPNRTARILGGVRLRDWFQRNFEEGDRVSVDLQALETIVLKG